MEKQAIHQNTLYILTDKGIKIDIEDHTMWVFGLCCFTTGRKSIEYTLDNRLVDEIKILTNLIITIGSFENFELYIIHFNFNHYMYVDQ